MTALSIALLGRGSTADDGTGDNARDGALKLNKNARLLEALAKGAVISATTTAQPVSPTVGDLYIIPSGKTGTDWSLMTNGSLALYAENGSVNAWFEITPAEGWRMHARDTDTLYRHDGSAWVILISPALADVVKAASLTLGRTAFGLAIGTDVLAYSALVQALAASAPSAGDFWYASSSTTVSKQASTSFGRSLFNLADAAALRTSAVLGTAATQNTGTSGANVPLLNGNNTHSGNNTFTGTITIANNTAVQLKSAGGSIYSVLYMYSDDHIYFDQQVAGGQIIFRGPSYTEVVRVDGANRLQMSKPIQLKSYTVAGLPAGAAGDTAFASNGRAYNGAGTLEGAGAGTGVAVTHNGTAWNIAGTNQTVQA